MPTHYFDVVICGAGPAGSTCALALEKSGLKVALLDKASFPREKICGDAVAPYAAKVLNTIDPKYLEAINKFNKYVLVDTCRVVAPNKSTLDVAFGESGFISMRMNFDNFLFELASNVATVKTFLNTTVKNVEVHERGVRVEAGEDLVFECAIVIGCDGAHSIIGKKLANTKVDMKHYSGAVRAYYKNVTGIPQKTFELHFLKDTLPGYFWIFPLPDNMANVGLGMLSQVVADKKVNLRKEMINIIENNSYLKDRFKNAEIVGEIQGYGLPLCSRKIPLSGNRFMLAGDAASLIDPATGEGIGQAMVSGRYAGWHAAACFENKNFGAEFMKGFDKTVYDKVWAESYKRYLFQRMLEIAPWTMNWGFYLALRNKWIYKMVKKLIW